MKYRNLMLGAMLLLFACKKDDKPSSGQTSNGTCQCEQADIDRFQFVNWDSSLDTVRIDVYEQGNNFVTPTTTYSKMPVGSDGYMEGFSFFLGADSAKEFRITLKHHPQVYKLKAYTYNIDTALCSMLNDSIRCFTSYQFTLNDSVIQIPKRIVNYNTKHADTLQLYL